MFHTFQTLGELIQARETLVYFIKSVGSDLVDKLIQERLSK